MTIEEKLEQDARDFVRRLQQSREEDSALRFKSSYATVTEDVTVQGTTKFATPPVVTDKTVFTPNSNGQGL